MIKYAFVTNQGPCHDENEDSIVINGKIYNKSNAKGSGFRFGKSFKIAVFDGVGGADCGEVASGVCANSFVKHCNPSHIFERDDIYDTVETMQNDLIIAQADTEEMMTTFVCAMSNGKEYIFANMGDSRAYLINDGKIKQYSFDDTYRNKLLREGRLSRKEIDELPIAHVITKCLGTDDFNKRDTHSYFVSKNKGQCYLMVMSDGVSDLVTEAELLSITTELGSPKKIVNRIEELVLKRGAHDNYSIIIIKD